jgi:chemotaxis protein CheC
MTETLATTTSCLELLHQLFASATHEASAAMCRWTNGLITLWLDEVREIPLVEVCEEMDFGDQLLTMVVLRLEGEIGGEMVLTFDDANARQLAAALLSRSPSDEDAWSPLEQSALTETGNILGCAYMNALTRLIGCELVPSVPFFVRDYAGSVFQQALLIQAATSDSVLICRTVFRRQGEELNWRVFFIPTEGMRVAMEKAFHHAAG